MVYVRFGTVMLRLVMVKAPLSDPEVLSKIPVPLVIDPASGQPVNPMSRFPRTCRRRCFHRQ